MHPQRAECVRSISIHAPPRGATRGVPSYIAKYLFQFTPLREGRRGNWVRKIKTIDISIHAPPRGATTPNLRMNANIIISIHAPPRGATRLKLAVTINCFNFNSRPSARGDSSSSAPPHSTIYFNSRPSARGDGKRYAISANLLFNPYKSAWLNNSATQFVEIILVIFHRIIA